MIAEVPLPKPDLTAEVPLPKPDLTAEVPLPKPDLTAPAPLPRLDLTAPAALLVFVSTCFAFGISSFSVSFFVTFTSFLVSFFGVSFNCDFCLKTIFGLSFFVAFFSLYSFLAESAATDSGSLSPNLSLYLSSKLLPFESIIKSSFLWMSNNGLLLFFDHSVLGLF